MKEFKCQNCGAVLNNVTPGARILVCEYCGASQAIELTAADVADEKSSALLRRCRLLLDDREFKKAAELCEEYLNEHPEDSEAYEILFLCDIKKASFDRLSHAKNWEWNRNYEKMLKYGSLELVEKYRVLKEEYNKNSEIPSNPELEALPDATFSIFDMTVGNATVTISGHFIKGSYSGKRVSFAIDHLKNIRAKTLSPGRMELSIFGRECDLGSNEVFYIRDITREAELKAVAYELARRVKISGNEKCELVGDIFNPDEAAPTAPETSEKPTKTEEPKPAASGGCYVATCVYGSYDCPEVWTLRRFRDDTLGTTWYGRLFIRVYYAISPTLVRRFGKKNWFKNMWRGTLDRMVAKLQARGVGNTPYEDKIW